MTNLNIEILPNLYYVGINDRHTPRFENIWPLPRGVAYNSYLIIDEKTALFDTVTMHRSDQFINDVTSKMSDIKIDYLISLHVEPDHAGAYRELLSTYPDITIVGNKITKRFLSKIFNLEPKNFIEVKDGDTLCLGKRSLTFYTTPNCHWPESMVAYEPNEHILLSQDIFGGFCTTNGRIFDDEIEFVELEEETRRYFSNIVGSHCDSAVKALQKLAPLPIKLICPVHGKIWRKNVSAIIKAYEDWATYKTEKGVVIAYGSMYGSTEAICDLLARYLVEEGIHKIRVFDLSQTHSSYILNEIWKYGAFVLACPTYNSNVMPVVSNFINILDIIDVKKHIFSYFTTYGWKSSAKKILADFAERSNMKLVQNDNPIDINGIPSNEDIESLKILAKKIASELNSMYND